MPIICRFDLVVNNYMFDLLPREDFGTVLSEFKRMLKPGGRLLPAFLCDLRGFV